MRKLLWFFFFFALPFLCPADILTVDDDGPADFNTIQAAIDSAGYGDTINVSAGTYIENLILKNGVALIGQDPNTTIINGNNNGSVVYSSNCDSNTILEDFTITNGLSASGGGGMKNYQSNLAVTNCIFISNYDNRLGGGIYNDNSSPRVRNCTFNSNTAQNGGGVCNVHQSSPAIENCTFISNTAYGGGGGGMCNIDSRPIVKGCKFTCNSARGEGGGMSNMHNSEPDVANCTFSGNSALYGGGIFNNDSQSIITDCNFNDNSADEGGGILSYYSGLIVENCSFRGNFAEHSGGGLLNNTCTSEIINCTFRDNSTALYSPMLYGGGGMYNRNVFHTVVTNCIFNGNSAYNGGGMSNLYNYSNLSVTNCTFSKNSAEYGRGMYNTKDSDTIVTNCIFWSDDSSGSGNEIFNYYSYLDIPVISYSDIDGCGGSGAGWDTSLGTDAGGNIDIAPLFANPDANDFHLQSQAGRWDPNTQGWVLDDVTSPCIDAGDWMTPVGLEPFPNGGKINMGAYGGTEQASKSYFGKPPCQTIIAGDINGDCIIDFKDFSIMSLHWLEEIS